MTDVPRRRIVRHSPKCAKLDDIAGAIVSLAFVALGSGCHAPSHIAATATAAPAAATSQHVELTVQQARADLVQAVADNPSDPASLVELAMFDERVRNVDGAVQELTDCCNRFPKYARSQYQLGSLDLMVGKRADALDPLKRAAALSKNDPEVQQAAALACYEAKHVEDAERYIQAEIAINPKSADSYLLLARIYDHHGTALTALKYAKKYLELSPNPGPGLFMMGTLYAHEGAASDAASWLERATAAQPRNPDYLTLLGRVYYEM